MGAATPPAMTTAERAYYKLDIQGIVYLVDPTTLRAYTYDMNDPTEIGCLVWTDSKLEPRIALHDNWQTIMAAKLAAQAPAPTPDA